jgi:hypothetical protein
MKKQHVFLALTVVILFFTVALNSCKKDEPTPLTLSTLVAGTINLNGATSATGVPVNPTIVATFATEVNATTATASNITLTEDYDAASIPLTIAVSGNTITLTLANPLAGGALYKISFGVGLLATNGLALPVTDRFFTTIGSFVPSGQVLYVNFNDNVNDQIGTNSPAAGGVIALTYVTSRSTAAGKAGLFNGSTSLVQIPNGDDLGTTHDFTLSVWVKSDTAGKGAGPQNFVLGCAAFAGFQLEMDYPGTGSLKVGAQWEFSDGTTGGQDTYFDGSGSYNGNGGWKGWTYNKDLTASGGVNAILVNKWANFIMTYKASTKVTIIYLNGERMHEQDYTLYDAPMTTTVGLKYAGSAGNEKLALGFIQDKDNETFSWASYFTTSGWPSQAHFKGQMDDLRIFHKALTTAEVTLMYNSEKP